MNGLTGLLSPIYCLAKPQPRERAWKKQAGKEDPVEFDSSPTLCGDIGGVVEVEAQAQMKYHHSERCFTYP